MAHVRSGEDPRIPRETLQYFRLEGIRIPDEAPRGASRRGLLARALARLSPLVPAWVHRPRRSGGLK